MKRLALSLVVVVVWGAAPASAATPAPPLSTVSSTSETQTIVTRLDPRSLAPVGPRAELDEYHGGWSYSPDRTKVAFGKSPAGGNSRGGIHVIDVARVELVQLVDTPVFMGALAWLRPNRMVGLLAGTSPVMVDAARGRLEALPRAARFGCSGEGPAAQTPRVLAWLSPRGIRTIDAAGRLRSARLRGLPRDCYRSSIVTDSGGIRAWVGGGASEVLEVDLRSMRVTPRPLRGSSPRGSRYTRLVPLGGGRLAAVHDRRREPAGVELIDPRRGSRRMIEPRGGGARLADGVLLVFGGGHPQVPRKARIGLRAYGPDGRIRYGLLRGERVWNVQVAGRHAWAIGTHGVAVVDVRSGRILSRSPDRSGGEVEFLSTPR